MDVRLFDVGALALGSAGAATDMAAPGKREKPGMARPRPPAEAVCDAFGEHREPRFGRFPDHLATGMAAKVATYSKTWR